MGRLDADDETLLATEGSNFLLSLCNHPSRATDNNAKLGDERVQVDIGQVFHGYSRGLDEPRRNNGRPTLVPSNVITRVGGR